MLAYKLFLSNQLINLIMIFLFLQINLFNLI